MAVLVGRILVLALAYYAGGRIGLSLAHYQENATLVWPPTGLALAALILYGVRLWPGVFLGTSLINATTGLTGLASFGISLGNTLEAVLGALLLARVANFRPSLERLRDVTALFGIGALGCTLVSATIGVGTLVLTGRIGTAVPWITWLIWWLGDAGAVIILTPVLLLAANGAPPWRVLFRNGEFWGALTLIIALISWSVSGAVTGPMAFAAVFTPYPVLVWAGNRLGKRGAVLASFSITLIATFATARGVGPFVVEGTHASTLLLSTFGIICSTTALTLAAATGQRDRAEQRYRSEEAQRLRIQRENLLLAERTRVAREIHDGLGGQLVSMLSMLERGRGSRAEMVEGLRRALDDMRIVIDSLDPNTTDFPTSLGKLRSRLEPQLRRNGIRLRWQVADSPALDAISPEASLHLLRIIQEAVSNVVQHAHADEIELSVAIRDDALSIEIRDNGCGPASVPDTDGHGIRNMKARAAALGAEFALETSEPGTRVHLRVPVPVPGHC